MSITTTIARLTTLRAFGAVGVVAALALTGCAATDGDAATASDSTSDASAAGPADGQWPRTVTVNEQSIELAAEPVRIVALSTETGDLGLELVGPERFAAVASGSVTEGTGNQLEQALLVETAMPPGTDPDPEMILSLEPDLVLMTGRHSGEQDVASILEESGVPTVAFTSSDFATPTDVIDTVTELGALLGAEAAADEITSGIQAQVDEVAASLEGVSDSPRVLVMLARGGRPMLMAGGSTTTSLVEFAGGTSIASEQGWTSAISADPEAILAVNPDVILVQDFRDQGLEPFSELLDNPALQSVTAIAGGEVHLVDAETTSGTAGSRIGEGLGAIASLLHPEVFA